MKADALSIGQLLGSNRQFVIPVFQRNYSWQRENWESVIADLGALLADGQPRRSHFLGTIVTSAMGAQPGVDAGLGDLVHLEVVDGQQRLITLALMLAALRDLYVAEGRSNDAQAITEQYLIRKDFNGFDRFHIRPRQFDREHFFQIIAPGEGKGRSIQGEAYGLFKRVFREFVQTGAEEETFEFAPQTLDRIRDTMLERFNIVVVTTGGEDPYQVFRALNDKGRDLSQADLIRNEIFRSIAEAEQEAFDRAYWAPIETAVGEGDGSPSRFDNFFRDAMAREGKRINLTQVYHEFASRYGGGRFDPAPIATEFGRLATLQSVINGKRAHEEPTIEAALERLRWVGTSNYSALILSVLELHTLGEMDEKDTVAVIDAAASLFARKYMVSEDMKNVYNWCCTAAGKLRKNGAQAAIASLESRAPTDEQFLNGVIKKRFNRDRTAVARGFLACIERHMRKTLDPIEPADFTLEHIAPLNPQTGRDRFGRRVLAETVDPRLIECIGNLTLVAQRDNNEMGNKPFSLKRSKLTKKDYMLNAYFRNEHRAKSWADDDISARAQWIAQHAVRVWIRPKA